MVFSIANGLNYLNAVGVFSYVIPFLLIFAVVFAIVDKSGFLGTKRPVHIIVSVAVGLLALQFDMVPVFFANIFPKMGIGLAIILVVLLFLGFSGVKTDGSGGTKWIGVAGAILVVLWAVSDFWWFGGGFYGGSFGLWFGDYFWALVILGLVIGAIVAVGKSGGTSGP